jgi:BolA family transcriptional regulator, general stress-responsive regulator
MEIRLERDALIKDMYQRLNTHCAPTDINIIDDSAHHVGHTGHRGGGHFTLEITSPRFQGLSLVKRHQLVYQALGDYVGREIHALSIIAKTPEE